MASPYAIELLEMMLILDPDERISVSSALRHDYLREYSVPNDEPVAMDTVKNSIVRSIFVLFRNKIPISR